MAKLIKLIVKRTYEKDLESKLPELLKIEDIAQFLRVSKRTVYNWIEFGELPAYRFGLGKKGCIRVFKKDFLEFIRSRKEVL
ncbi:MAG: helix-turn-helix domain-containing protein [candidate division WOR-3 bacterium]